MVSDGFMVQRLYYCSGLSEHISLWKLYSLFEDSGSYCMYCSVFSAKWSTVVALLGPYYYKYGRHVYNQQIAAEFIMQHA